MRGSYRFELLGRSFDITIDGEMWQLESYRETTFYSTEPTPWKDILALFCGGYKAESCDYSRGYYFPSDEAMIHFALLIGERDREQAAWYYKFYSFKHLVESTYDPYHNILF